MNEAVECYRFQGRVLCLDCGESECETIQEGGGHGPEFWDYVLDEIDYPQRRECSEGVTCAECGRIITGVFL